eukprot:m.71259 g.71259  ORF g.71259 m.71259 type:complete len:222 (-) comp16897_c0_seq1:38-703(-)
MTDLQEYQRVGFPVVSFFFLTCVIAVFLAFLMGVPSQGPNEGPLSSFKLAFMLLLVAQVIFGGFLIVSDVAPYGLSLAFIPLMGLWALHTMHTRALYGLILTEAFAVYVILGVGGATLFTIVQVDSCQAAFDSDTLCDDSWKTFLQFLLTLYFIFAHILVLGGMLYLTYDPKQQRPQQQQSQQPQQARGSRPSSDSRYENIPQGSAAQLVPPPDYPREGRV